jgi:sugar phosphate isomerase/epimerase
MAITRRQLGRLAATAVGTAAAGVVGIRRAPVWAAPRPVVIGVQSYSFRDRPLVEALAAMASLGVPTCELWQGHLEPKGLPREELRRWRLTTPLSFFREVAAKFKRSKVGLCAYNYSIKDDFSEAEIERGFLMAKALGAPAITASAHQNVVARIAPLARKHRCKVALHNHSVLHPNEFATPHDFELALGAPGDTGRRFMAVNLDIGHFTAANFDSVEFLEKYHDRVVTLHIKDRKRDQGPAVPFGEGDAPIKQVLQLVRDRGWRIPANVEYEYKGGDSVAEVRRCLDYCRGVLTG